MRLVSKLGDKVLARLVPEREALAAPCECSGTTFCTNRNCYSSGGCQVCQVWCCNGCNMTYRSTKKYC